MATKFKCPQCGSTRVYGYISIQAKQNLNTSRVYEFQPWNIDNFFEESCGCEKCGFEGPIDRFDPLKKEDI